MSTGPAAPRRAYPIVIHKVYTSSAVYAQIPKGRSGAAGERRPEQGRMGYTTREGLIKSNRGCGL